VRSASTATEWNVEEGTNIRWRTPIPGLAHSSPVIAGDRIFVTTAIREAGEDELKVGLYGSIAPVGDDSPHEFRVLCLDKNTGEILWDELAVNAVPAVKRHPKGSHAASSPATDGRYVLAFFASEGLYCYTIDGELKWKKDFGVLDSGYFMVKDAQWGFASSPVIHGDKAIVQCDVQDQSFLTALDIETGKEIWRTYREEAPGWGTPTVVNVAGRDQIICNGWHHIGAYDLETGEEIWKTGGGGDIPVPTPVIAHDLAFITNAHGRMSPMMAVKLDAKGEFPMSEDDERIAWLIPRGGNYMQTPIVIGDLIFFCKDNGVVTCLDAKTGEEHFGARLGSGRTGFTASPVAAGDKIYYTSETGEIHVVHAGKEFKVLAINDMGTECMATPAISGDVLYWRTRNEVVAISEK
jgi:outer membrane protein assembly factor BamB